VAEAFAAHLAERNFHAALVADDAAVLHALVLAAQALPVSDRAKDTGAEQSVAFRFEGAVVDRLRLGYFTVRPAANLLRRGELNLNGVEIRNVVSEIEWARAVQIASSPGRSVSVQDLRPCAADVRLPVVGSSRWPSEPTV
jgi:hypothetical protein